MSLLSQQCRRRRSYRRPSIDTVGILIAISSLLTQICYYCSESKCRVLIYSQLFGRQCCRQVRCRKTVVLNDQLYTDTAVIAASLRAVFPRPILSNPTTVEGRSIIIILVRTAKQNGLARLLLIETVANGKVLPLGYNNRRRKTNLIPPC